jgi:hypothetical protein
MLTKDFKEFSASLNASGAEYLVVGGYALAAHGHPRYTGDLDFWIGTARSNARRVLEALARFGFGSLQITEEDLSRPDSVVQLGVPPNRIDLLTSIDGVSFADCYARQMPVDVDGVVLNFISLEDLKANKRASGRMKDRADLEELGDPPDAPPDPGG